MAQVVAQRQVVTTKTQLTQKQSTETVQVMLYTSLRLLPYLHPTWLTRSQASMLCRLRSESDFSVPYVKQADEGIFPSLAFDVVDFDDDDELYTLEGLMNGEHPCRAQHSSPSSTSMRQSERESLNVPLLKRGRSVRADQFLDSLDTAFEALHRGTLHALRIPFMSDPETDSNSLELWSFRIVYKPSSEGERLVQGLETKLGNDDVYDPSLCVVDLLGQIYDQCGELPQLPDDRYIQPSILYREDGWEPKGFMETQSQPSVQGFAGWHPHTADLGIIGGVHHDLALRIASLKHEHSNTRRISQDLRFRKPESVRGGRLSARTSTLSSGNSSIQPRTISPAPSRETSAVSAIPKTPQRNDQSDKNEASSTNSHALTEVASNLVLDGDALSANGESQNPATTPDISEQLPHSDVSSASQVDDDMRRRNSLDNMVSSVVRGLSQD
ncbi:hypothetical protein E4T49_03712 [Aureobasidium sp. EXF-10728]|nr:hypothetical protein E4T49_03712 [Aureobasidium sp. EXF-10728]